uniref:MOB-like protein phocein n=1 Tax=Taeniopygia guttata TaxID=59729 RepID=A0A674H3X2_TAEGU
MDFLSSHSGRHKAGDSLLSTELPALCVGMCGDVSAALSNTKLCSDRGTHRCPHGTALTRKRPWLPARREAEPGGKGRGRGRGAAAPPPLTAAPRTASRHLSREAVLAAPPLPPRARSCPAPRGPAAHPGPAVAMVMAEGTAVLRRNRPGTKAQDFYNWPDESFEEMDSTLAVQQYIQQNIRADCSNIDKILEPPEGQDEGVWKYEHLRQFCLELNGLAVKLQSECHPDTCTQMTATEQWIFLCAAHKTPKECPAIDYTRHTLDGAACLLNSNKYFPSRVSIKESSVAKLGSVCRRIYRIFSHAYFHHRQIFDEYENETFLCHRFTKFVMKYNLMSKDNLIVPILEEEVQNSVSGESEA